MDIPKNYPFFWICMITVFLRCHVNCPYLLNRGYFVIRSHGLYYWHIIWNISSCRPLAVRGGTSYNCNNKFKANDFARNYILVKRFQVLNCPIRQLLSACMCEETSDAVIPKIQADFIKLLINIPYNTVRVRHSGPESVFNTQATHQHQKARKVKDIVWWQT